MMLLVRESSGMMVLNRVSVLAALLAVSLPGKQPLVVISVDGLDNRYVAQANQMGLKIPHLRRLRGNDRAMGQFLQDTNHR
jgi:hypothetical protein